MLIVDKNEKTVIGYSFWLPIKNSVFVDFMKKEGVKVTVRGLRNEDDYKYETTMARYNEDMYPEVVTVYIPASTNPEEGSPMSVILIIIAIILVVAIAALVYFYVFQQYY